MNKFLALLFSIGLAVFCTNWWHQNHQEACSNPLPADSTITIGMAKIDTIKNLNQPKDSVFVETDSISMTNEVVLKQLKEPINLYLNNKNDDIDHSAEVDAFIVMAKDYLSKNPTAKFILTGYSDNLGSEAENMNKSKQRAERVLGILSENGFLKNQFEVLAKGSKDPIGPNNNTRNRDLNRRISLKLK